MVPLFLVLLCVTSALAQHTNCAPTDLTIDQKLELNADANDHNGDNITDTTDIEYDLDENYDANDDGEVDEEEWIARWTCAFGDTQYYARFTFNQIGNGQPEIRGSDFDREPLTTGVPRAQFISVNRQRYETFAQLGCVNTDLTLEEKLTMIGRNNDRNNNSLVESTDIIDYLSSTYDSDDDGELTMGEFVLGWCCAYGDTAHYARYVFEGVRNRMNETEVIVLQEFNEPPANETRAGAPLADFVEANRQRWFRYQSEQEAPVGK